MQSWCCRTQASQEWPWLCCSVTTSPLPWAGLVLWASHLIPVLLLLLKNNVLGFRILQKAIIWASILQNRKTVPWSCFTVLLSGSMLLAVLESLLFVPWYIADIDSIHLPCDIISNSDNKAFLINFFQDL